MTDITAKQIAAAKAAVASAYPQAGKLQYHQATDAISGTGWQLVRPVHAVTNLDCYGNGRFVLARREMNGEWTSVEGGMLLAAD